MPENRKRDQIQWIPGTGDPSSVDTPLLSYPGQLGGVYSDANGGEWQFVQGDSSMTVAPFPGATMWWADRVNFKVTTSPTTLGRGRVAGCIPVFQKDGITRVPSKSAGNYFFVQKGGLAKIKFIDSPTATPDATGKNIIPSATAGKADCLGAGTAPTYPPIGVSAGTLDAVNMECVVDLSINAETN